MRRIYSLGTGIGLDNPRTVCKSKFWLANIFFIFSASLLPPILIPDYRGKALILRITAVSKPFRTRRFVNLLLPKSFQLVISTNAPPPLTFLSRWFKKSRIVASRARARDSMDVLFSDRANADRPRIHSCR